jgi:hypothetical protein
MDELGRVFDVVANVAADWDPAAERAILGDLDAVANELERLRAAVALHVKVAPRAPRVLASCRACSVMWPCPTARAAGIDQ